MIIACAHRSLQIPWTAGISKPARVPPQSRRPFSEGTWLLRTLTSLFAVVSNTQRVRGVHHNPLAVWLLLQAVNFIRVRSMTRDDFQECAVRAVSATAPGG